MPQPNILDILKLLNKGKTPGDDDGSGRDLSSSAISDILKAREAKEAAGDYSVEPGLRDIFDYVKNEGNSAIFLSPNTSSGGEAGTGSTNHTPWETIMSGGGDNASYTTRPTVDPRFKDAVTLFQSNAGGEGSSGWETNVDDSKMPSTIFGGVSGLAPVDKNTPLINPALVVNDPNYGWVTPAKNVKPDKVNNMTSAAILSAMMGGMGLLAAPAAGAAGAGLFGGAINPASLGIGLVNIAKGIGGGNPNFGSMLSMIMGAAGVPNSNIFGTLLNAALKYGKGGGGKG